LDPILHSFLFSSIGAQVESEHVLIRLWIGRATSLDSGNYTCSIPGHKPDDFPRARVKVHVVDGELKISWAVFPFILRLYFSGEYHAAVYGKSSRQIAANPLLPLMLLMPTVCSTAKTFLRFQFKLI
jgi:hypothetical protein